MRLRLLAASAILTWSTPIAAQAIRIDRISEVVSDARATADFYQKVLGFERLSEVDDNDPAKAAIYALPPGKVRTITLRLGDETIALVQYLDRPGRPVPRDSRSQDRWFQHFAIIVSDMTGAYAKVSAAHPAAISEGGAQLLPPNTGAVTAYKFRDPEGHPLELLFLPAGVGRPRWHDGRSGLFLGIDHSAIGVARTAESVHFYRDLLGFTVAGGSLNQGAEQARLDGAANATVAITPLRPSSTDGPGVELLNYLEPADGRPARADTQSNDIWATTIQLRVNDLPRLADRLKSAGVNFVSPGIVAVRKETFTHALLVRDPDGHALLLTE